MSRLLVLPSPLPSSSIALGQLITDPLYASSASLKPASKPASKESHVQSKYEDTVAHDEYGRFTSTRFVSKLNKQPHYSHENLLLLNAERMSHTTLDKPAAVFNALSQGNAARTFLRNMARQHTPVYFVIGVQTLTNPSFKRAVVEHGIVAEAKPPQFRLPVRRVDSASSFDSAKESAECGSVLAVELLKVKCRIGEASEPHCVADLEYTWNYHRCDQNPDLQLSIGLGKAMTTCELRTLAGIPCEDEYTDNSYASSYSDSEEDGMGMGGF